MGRRKLKTYGDADIEGALESYLRRHKKINYVGTRDLRSETREDLYHYREARKQRRVLVSHNDDFLDNEKYPLHETEGVIVVKRKQSLEIQALALDKFITWLRVGTNADGTSTLGCFKVQLSADGFHYWRRHKDGNSEEGYLYL